MEMTQQRHQSWYQMTVINDVMKPKEVVCVFQTLFLWTINQQSI